MTYGIFPWDGALATCIEPLQNLQKRILRIIYKNRFPDSSRPLNIEQLYTLECLTYHYQP